MILINWYWGLGSYLHPEFLQDAKANGHSFCTLVLIWAQASHQAARPKQFKSDGGAASSRDGTGWHSPPPPQFVSNPNYSVSMLSKKHIYSMLTVRGWRIHFIFWLLPMWVQGMQLGRYCISNMSCTTPRWDVTANNTHAKNDGVLVITVPYH